MDPINYERLASDDLEETVLGSCFLDPPIVMRVAKAGGVELFWRRENQIVWKAMLSRWQASKGFDLLTILDDLRIAGTLELAGDAARVTTMSHGVFSTVHVHVYIEQLQELQRLRRLADMSGSVRVGVEKGDTSKTIIEELARDIRLVSAGTAAKGVDAPTTAASVWQYITDLHAGTVQPYYSTNQGWMDKVLGGGITPGHSYFVGALYKTGKTKFVSSVIIEMLKQEWAVDWWSVEMPAKELGIRWSSCYTGIHEEDIYEEKLSPHEMTSLSEFCHVIMPKWRFEIFHQARPSVPDIYAETAARVAEIGSDRLILVVDYMQSVRSGEKLLGHEEVATVSQRLNEISKDLGVAVFVIYQLAVGAVEGRAGLNSDFIPMPLASDIRGSKQGAMDANHLIVLHRPYMRRKDKLKNFLVVERQITRRGGGGEMVYRRSDAGRNRFPEWDDDIPPHFKPLTDHGQASF